MKKFFIICRKSIFIRINPRFNPYKIVIKNRFVKEAASDGAKKA